MVKNDQISPEESLDLLASLLAEVEGGEKEEKKELSETALVETIAQLLETESKSDRAVSSQPDPPSPQKPTEKPNLSQVPSQKRASAPSELQKCQQQIADLEQKLVFLQERIDRPTDLINPLLPLIRQLLEMKTGESKEAILEAVVPVIDKIIAQRVQADRSAVANAISMTIPLAINQQVKAAPKEIANAIAPEIALAIQEQTRLQQNAMSEALGPEMGRAIKNQIALERDAMVDALYPVIGDTISKYMAEVIEAINEKVENALSPAGITRKFRARWQGVSEAELILRESMPFTVQAVFLIHKTSGLVIQEAQPTSNRYRLESEMLAGMLTAIRQFVTDCVADSEETPELNEIEYGNSRIILEVAGYCYLATIVKGNPSFAYQQQMRKTLSAIVQQQGEVIQAYDGDPETIPDQVRQDLETLLIPETDSQPQKSGKKFPTALLSVVLGLVGVIVIPWGVFWHRQRVANTIESDIAIALDAAPDLSVYRLLPEVSDETVTLTGRVPTASLREQAEQIARSEVPENFQLNNQIVAVNVPPPPETIAAEVQRMVEVLNQQQGVKIAADYEAGKVSVRGIVPQLSDAEAISEALMSIPGVASVTNTWQLEPEVLRRRIDFDRGSAKVDPVEVSKTLKPMAAFLQSYPHLHLKITGYTDQSGSLKVKQKIAIARSQTVKNLIVKQGISPDRLITSAAINLPPGVTPQSPSKAMRVVRFSVFVP